MANDFKNKINSISRKSPIPEMYERLSKDRSGYLTRGQDYSRMTLPYLLPSTDTRSGAGNQHGFQGIGAQATNHLSNKIVITLFPPQRSFFRLELASEAEAALAEAGFSKTDLAEHLSSIETRTQTVQEDINARSGLTEATKQLTVTGNVCLYLPPKGKMQAIPLSQYVVRRDTNGDLVELITCYEKMLMSFEPAEQAMIRASSGRSMMKGEEKVKLYTQAKLVDDFFIITQSAFDTPIGKQSRIKPEKLPWIPLRWNTCYGEDYGRGLVEDHAGDFAVIEFLSEAIAKGMIIMADVKYLVKPGSVTDIDHLITSPTGEFLNGNIDDIGVLQLAKYADFSPISEVLLKYEQRVGQAFMLSSANRRQAERVTAYEIRLDAVELETSLGGIYSSLAQSMQRPLAYLYLGRISTQLGSSDVNPVILTGLEALGRAGDMDKIAQFSEMMQMPAQWPEGVQTRVKWGEYSRNVAASLSMSLPWLMTDAELQAQQEAAQQANAQNNAMMEAGKAAPDVVKQQVGGQQ